MKVFLNKDDLKVAIVKYFNGIDKTTDISNWDTSAITDMSLLFYNMPYLKCEPIVLNWDTRNVTTMKYMFENCNQNFILNFDTRNVTDMSCMFRNSHYFNSPLYFDTSNVKNMSYMFCRASSFNQLLNFNTSNVEDMRYMFNGAYSFNQPLNFDTSKVYEKKYMFNFAQRFEQPIYFIKNYWCEIDMFYNSNSVNIGAENKYLLPFKYYWKLILFSIMDKINYKLLYCCDGVEEYIIDDSD